jgi:hypothetical protein
MRTLLFVLLSLVATAQPRQTVFSKVFDGVTAVQASSPLPNIGQTMHVITVLFPAEVSGVTGIQVRLEASFDNTTYFPISADITSAPLVGGRVYNIQVAYGPWPYVRVRTLVDTGAKLMTVQYAGSGVPTVPAVTQESDRFIL